MHDLLSDFYKNSNKGSPRTADVSPRSSPLTDVSRGGTSASSVELGSHTRPPKFISAPLKAKHFISQEPIIGSCISQL